MGDGENIYDFVYLNNVTDRTSSPPMLYLKHGVKRLLRTLTPVLMERYSRLSVRIPGLLGG
ncbi:uncharacterized protein BDW43DRAFT_281883 [Aspergillus alliaceus]|uniref:uncharacterized protein n=1 Tax=Petromyces alliaceus TaxID=209559 RepID=UPI0012A60CB6|nr:uncharacterized protein BDW43DRAFT_281883 [Aspergillus alliaceus]KAB8231583.1 hypothetical protein BDW43DRAFT_281883 [Aspergillus alliaceus]